jgi:hypothetical protein
VSTDNEGGKETVATQSPAIQAEYIKSLQLKVYKDASELELEEIAFAGEPSHYSVTNILLSSIESCFLDTRAYHGERDVESLPNFISDGTRKAPRDMQNEA